MDWIFGYGSLMWFPGFDCRERRPARLKGYHRDFCMVSHRNRGTEAVPGLVLSLCPGGELTGVAFRFEPGTEARAAALAYLDDREGIHRAHERAVVPIEFLDGPEPATAPAWTYLPVLTAANYDGRMPLERRAALVAQGRGKIGTSLEYLTRLMDELDRLDVRDTDLRDLLAAARHTNTLAAPSPGAAAADD